MYRLILLLALLTQFATSRGQQHDTLRVFFPLDKSYLTDESRKFLDSLISHKVLKQQTKIVLLGYGDYLGENDYNKTLSYARAKTVQDHLVISGFNQNDITLIVGKGKINRAMTGKQGNAIDRKVDIVINRVIDTPAKEKFTYYMYRMKTDETLPLHNIQFYRGSTRMVMESMPELNLLIGFMQENPTWKIQLEGHVCCLGTMLGQDESYDESTLSEKRAHSVLDSLVAHGIAADRIKCVGFGNSKPIIYPEESEEDGRVNRRVEVRVLSK